MFSLNQAQETSQHEDNQDLSYFGPVPQEPKQEEQFLDVKDKEEENSGKDYKDVKMHYKDLHLDTSKSPYNSESRSELRRFVKVRSQTLSEA